MLTLGVDVGQRVDPTAIAVVEIEDRPFYSAVAVASTVGDTPLLEPERYEQHFTARYLERLPIGTSYPEVTRRLVTLVTALRVRVPDAYPTLYLDATGVGTPVLDMLIESQIAATVVPVYFVHGERRREADDGVRLGKAYMVSRLQALLQSRRLHLPRTAEAEQLARELLNYEIRVDENAKDTYGAFKVGTHDDLVTALGLAVQDDGVALPYTWMRAE